MIRPMLCKLVKEPFDSEDWIFEIKWDGYRAIGVKKKKVEILSRNGLSFNDRFPELVKELSALPGSFVVDGEIVILDKKGRSHFQLLQNYQREKIGVPYYYLFDILSFNNQDLTHLPLLERRKILKALLQKRGRHLRYSESISGSGKAFFKQAKKQNLEGIIAKRKGSLYVHGRSSDWLKIKTHLRQEVVIGGFTAPRGTRKRFGALLVGVYQKGKLHYAGHVGGGFNQKLLEDVYKELKKRISSHCPFQPTPRSNMPVTWVKPQLVCEVAFAEWTREGIMRQPIFQGLRIDKTAKEVVRERTSSQTI